MARKPWITAGFAIVYCSMSVNSTTVHDLYCLWGACPCLSWSAVAMRALTWVVFVPGFLHAMLCSGSSPSPTQQWAGHIAWHETIWQIFKCTHLKFMVYGCKQASKHTHTSGNAVPLVWSSFRLALITLYTSINRIMKSAVTSTPHYSYNHDFVPSYSEAIFLDTLPSILDL